MNTHKIRFLKDPINFPFKFHQNNTWGIDVKKEDILNEYFLPYDENAVVLNYTTAYSFNSATIILDPKYNNHTYFYIDDKFWFVINVIPSTTRASTFYLQMDTWTTYKDTLNVNSTQAVLVNRRMWDRWKLNPNQDKVIINGDLFLNPILENMEPLQLHNLTSTANDAFDFRFIKNDSPEGFKWEMINVPLTILQNAQNPGIISALYRDEKGGEPMIYLLYHYVEQNKTIPIDLDNKNWWGVNNYGNHQVRRLCYCYDDTCNLLSFTNEKNDSVIGCINILDNSIDSDWFHINQSANANGWFIIDKYGHITGKVVSYSNPTRVTNKGSGTVATLGTDSILYIGAYNNIEHIFKYVYVCDAYANLNVGNQAYCFFDNNNINQTNYFYMVIQEANSNQGNIYRINLDLPDSDPKKPELIYERKSEKWTPIFACGYDYTKTLPVEIKSILVCCEEGFYIVDMNGNLIDEKKTNFAINKYYSGSEIFLTDNGIYKWNSQTKDFIQQLEYDNYKYLDITKGWNQTIEFIDEHYYTTIDGKLIHQTGKKIPYSVANEMIPTHSVLLANQDEMNVIFPAGEREIDIDNGKWPQYVMIPNPSDNKSVQITTPANLLSNEINNPAFNNVNLRLFCPVTFNNDSPDNYFLQVEVPYIKKDTTDIISTSTTTILKYPTNQIFKLELNNWNNSTIDFLYKNPTKDNIDDIRFKWEYKQWFLKQIELWWCLEKVNDIAPYIIYSWLLSKNNQTTLPNLDMKYSFGLDGFTTLINWFPLNISKDAGYFSNYNFDILTNPISNQTFNLIKVPAILPTYQNAYSNYILNSKNSYDLQREMIEMSKYFAGRENTMRNISNFVGGIGSLFAGAGAAFIGWPKEDARLNKSMLTGSLIGGALNSGINIASGLLSNQENWWNNAILPQKQLDASIADMKRSGGVINNLSMDTFKNQAFYFDILNGLNNFFSGYRLIWTRFSEQSENSLQEFMYWHGYQTDLWENISSLAYFHTRRYFDFFQIQNINLVFDNIPIYLQQELKYMFENGVRFWHDLKPDIKQDKENWELNVYNFLLK